jgi:hypothetical protein
VLIAPSSSRSDALGSDTHSESDTRFISRAFRSMGAQIVARATVRARALGPWTGARP